MSEVQVWVELVEAGEEGSKLRDGARPDEEDVVYVAGYQVKGEIIVIDVGMQEVDYEVWVEGQKVWVTVHFFIDYVEAFCLGDGRIQACNIYSCQYCIVWYV